MGSSPGLESLEKWVEVIENILETNLKDTSPILSSISQIFSILEEFHANKLISYVNL